MRTNPNRDAAERQRILDRLERKHDKRGAPFRQFQQDKQDIVRLLRAKDIDHDHSAILYDQAKATYDAARAKQKAADAKGKPSKPLPPADMTMYYLIPAIIIGLTFLWLYTF